MTILTRPSEETIESWLQRITADLRAVLFPFLVSRALIFFIFVAAFSTTVQIPGRQFGIAPQELRTELERGKAVEAVRQMAIRADAGWYQRIARIGYEKKQFDAESYHDWAFFPVFPLLWRAAAHLTGEFSITGVVLSNLLFLVALVLLNRLALLLTGDPQIAPRSVWYMAIFPTSYFFSLPITESLFLAVTLGAFLAALKDRWTVAGALGAVAASTRVLGLLLMPVLLLSSIERNRRPGFRIFWLSVIPIGLLAFMAHLKSITGDPLAFVHAQAAWGRSAGLHLKPVWAFFEWPSLLIAQWDFRLMNFMAEALVITCGVTLLLRRQWSLALFTLLSILIPLTSAQGSLQSLARYSVVIFPVFILMAEAAERHRWLDQLITIVSISGLAILTAASALFLTFALS